MAAAVLAVATQAFWWEPLARQLTALELRMGAWSGGFDLGQLGVALLPVVALGAGLLASVSPCILPLVPIQLATIGAADAPTRGAAARLAGRFVLGAAAALTVLGAAGDLGGQLLVAQRGFVLLGVGTVTLYLALV
ncbi:MAG: cytochrome c biogenesis protein CcdA, partial [Myxococcota bacterium]